MTKIDFNESSVGKVNAGIETGFNKALEVTNTAIQGDAIWGVASQEKGVGVTGVSHNWMAVVGISDNRQGVHGMSKNAIGVVGSTNEGTTGVWGLANNLGNGVMGESKGGIGVLGETKGEFQPGVLGINRNNTWYGVQGFSNPEGVGAILADGGKFAFVARNGINAAGRFEGDVEVTGDIRMVNADCAEDFDISNSETKDNVEAGTVMVLTENGSLQQSYQEYDKKVAGIVSGASGYKPAIVLDRQEVQQQEDQNNTNNNNNKSRLPIALMGKVYCKVDARHNSIEIGDLLTTSSTKGYAMKAQDPLQAFGAVIGKALGSIKQGSMGMIPVLVALQ